MQKLDFSRLLIGHAQRSMVFCGSTVVSRKLWLASVEQRATEDNFAVNRIDLQGFTAKDPVETVVELGKEAKFAQHPVCLLVDELQCWPADSIIDLCVGIHRCDQLDFPIMLFCTGEDKILRKLGRLYPDSEKLFHYIHN